MALNINKIIANPPFNKKQDAIHFIRMFDILPNNSSITCIVPKCYTFRQDKVYQELRNLINVYNAEIKELPENSFKSSGTNINVDIIHLEKIGG